MPKVPLTTMLLGFVSIAAAAVPIPSSPEIQVNEFTTGRQLISSVAVLPGGTSLVVWEAEDGGDRSIFGRLVSAAGLASGAQFQVSTGTGDDRTSASVAALPGGSFFVAWEIDEVGGSSLGGRRYDAAGVASAPVVVAASAPGVDAFDPSVTPSDGDSFVVVWDSYDQGLSESSVRSRFFDEAGGAEGPGMALESASDGENVFSQALSSRSPDGFVVSWLFDSAEGRELRAREYTPGGAADGAFLTVTDDGATASKIGGLDDGGYLVVWNDSTLGLQRRRARGDGTVEPAVDITASTESQVDPSVIGLPGGRAAVAWQQRGAQFADPDRILVQIVAADDSVETELQVDESTVGVTRPNLAYDTARDELLVTWTRRGTPGTDQEEVYFRRFALTGIFYDGFETGDTTGWEP